MNSNIEILDKMDIQVLKKMDDVRWIWALNTGTLHLPHLIGPSSCEIIVTKGTDNYL